MAKLGPDIVFSSLVPSPMTSSLSLPQAQMYSDTLTRNESEKPCEDQRVDAPLKRDGPCPSWLVNMKYLSPLISAYDDKIKEKDKTLIHCRFVVKMTLL